MTLMDLEKTPWVDRAFAAFWERIVAAAPRPEWVPRLLPGQKGLKVEEFGCGLYGCAIPTSSPKVLVKITSDPSEAAFAISAMAMGSWPSGIVKYYAAYAVPNVTYRGRPVSVLWRDEVAAVGIARIRHDALYKPHEERLLTQLGHALVTYKNLGMDLRSILIAAASRNPAEPWRLLAEAKALEEWAMDRFEDTNEAGRIVLFKGPERIAGLLQLITLMESEMMNTDHQDTVGEALSFYHEHGIVLADVHPGNVGRRGPGADEPREIVITDPGHAVALEQRLATVRVPALP